MAGVDRALHQALQGAFARAHQTASDTQSATQDLSRRSDRVLSNLDAMVRGRRDELRANDAEMRRLFTILRMELLRRDIGKSPAGVLKELQASDVAQIALSAAGVFLGAARGLCADAQRAGRDVGRILRGDTMAESPKALAEASRAAALVVLHTRIFFRFHREICPGFERLLLSEVLELARVGRPWPRELGQNVLGVPCLHVAAAEQLNAPLLEHLLEISNDDATRQLGCGCSRISIVEHAMRSWAQERMMHKEMHRDDSRAFIMLIARAAGGLSPILRDTLQRETLSALLVYDRSRAVDVVEDLFVAFSAHSPRSEHVRLAAHMLTLAFALGKPMPFLEAHGEYFAGQGVRMAFLDAAEPARLDADSSLTAAYAFLTLGEEDVTSWFLTHQAALGELTPLTYRIDAPKRAYADMLGHLALQNDARGVQALGKQLAQEDYAAWEARLLWPARLQRLKQALDACQQDGAGSAGLLTEQALTALHAVVAVVLVDAALLELECVRQALSLFVELGLMLNVEWHMRGAEQRKQLERVVNTEPLTSVVAQHTRAHASAARAFSESAITQVLAELPRPSKAQLKSGAQRMRGFASLLAPLGDAQLRRTLYERALRAPPAALMLSELARGLRQMQLPRLAQVYVHGGVSAARLLARDGPPLSAREHASLLVLLLAQGAGGEPGDRAWVRTERWTTQRPDDTHAERRALLDELSCREAVLVHPEIVGGVALAAVSFDAIVWLEGWEERLGLAHASMWQGDERAQRAALDTAPTASPQALMWVLRHCAPGVLGEALSTSDEDGDTPLHRLARCPDAGLQALLGRAPRQALVLALQLRSASGLTPALEALAAGQLPNFELLQRCADPEVAPWQRLSGDELALALAQSPATSLNAIVRRLEQNPHLAEQLRAHLPALAVQLAEGALGAQLRRLARSEPEALLTARPGEPTVFHVLARLGMRELFAQLKAQLGAPLLRDVMQHRDASGALAHDLAAEEAFARELSLFKSPARGAKQKLRSGLESALYDVATATSAKSCEQAVASLLERACEAQRKEDKSGRLRPLVDSQCWLALDVAARWRAPGMGIHYAAHRPQIPLATLRARALRRELSCSSRFAPNDGFRLLMGRSQALLAAEAALEDLSLTLAPLILDVALGADSGSEGFARSDDGSLVHKRGLTHARFVLAGHNEGVWAVSIYPVLLERGLHALSALPRDFSTQLSSRSQRADT